MNKGSVLRDIGTYKNTLISTFVNSHDICSVLLDKDDYTEEDTDNIVYSQIFPYLYADDTQTEVLSYLCCEVDIPRVPTGTIKDAKVIIWIYAHKRCMKYAKKGYVGTRVDVLSDMVEKLLRDSYEFGIGKLQLSSVINFSPIRGYYGRQIVFNMPEFKFGNK